MTFGDITAKVFLLLGEKKILVFICLWTCVVSSVVRREWRTLAAKQGGVSVNKACYNKCELSSVTSINLSTCYCMACLRLVA